MKSKLFLNKPKFDLNRSREFNIQNGNDSEQMAASKLINALNAEVRWGSRNEDGSKIDLILSFKHAWNNEIAIVPAQIKSGDSYAEEMPKGFLKVKKAIYRISKLKFNTLLIVWQSSKTNESYWFNIYPKDKSETKIIGKNHNLNPSTKYELSRLYSLKNKHGNTGGKNLVINFQKHSATNTKSLRKIIKETYRNFSKVNCPYLGEIEFSLLGWNHMFRKSRKLKYKKQSMKVIPYLKQLLSQFPSKTYISYFNKENIKGFTYCTYEHIATYDEVKMINNQNESKIIIKCIEEIRFPIDWNNQPLITQTIDRKVVFKSCSIK